MSLAPRPYRSRARPGGEGSPVTVFASCLVDRMLPEAGLALERILRAAGHRVELPRAQWCCGLISSNARDFARGARLFDGLALAGSGGTVVPPSGACFGAVTIDSLDWGGAGGPAAAALRERLRDSTRFVLELLESRPSLVRPVGSDVRPRVAYHDSCQSKRQL